MGPRDIDAAVAAIEELELIAANGDGDSADSALSAEDALLFDVLKAIANGAENPQDLAQHVIQACSWKLRGRCNAAAISNTKPG